MVMTTVLSGRHAEPVTEPPEPEVPERATRRSYTAQYKLRILAETNAGTVMVEALSCDARGCIRR